MSDNAARLADVAASLAPLPAGQPAVPAGLTPAAVLVGLRPHPGGTGIVLMQRSHHPADPHSGQVALPGGKIDPGDSDIAATARREAAEEIGLPAAEVRLLGALTPHTVRTGFRIHPVVAQIPAAFTPAPAAAEVAAVFELALADLLAPGAVATESRVIAGERAAFYVIAHERYRIWGATAAVLADLAARLRGLGAAASEETP